MLEHGFWPRLQAQDIVDAICFPAILAFDGDALHTDNSGSLL